MFLLLKVSKFNNETHSQVRLLIPQMHQIFQSQVEDPIQLTMNIHLIRPEHTLQKQICGTDLRDQRLVIKFSLLIMDLPADTTVLIDLQLVPMEWVKDIFLIMDKEELMDKCHGDYRIRIQLIKAIILRIKWSN